jgi:hypothetical protein
MSAQDPDSIPVDENADADMSDEFIPDVAHVYELVDAAEDRLAAQITRIAEEFNAKLDVLLTGNQWLGENVVPALVTVNDNVGNLHVKFDAVIADIRGFVTMVKTSKNPLARMMLKRGGEDNASPEAEDE